MVRTTTIMKKTAKKSDKAQDILVKLVAKLYEYVALLGDELNSVAPIAHVHGWRSTRVAKGKELRSKIKALRLKYVRASGREL
jgi:hypothetical protein